MSLSSTSIPVRASTGMTAVIAKRVDWFSPEWRLQQSDAIGARVEIEAGGRTQIGEVRSGDSYLSHNDMHVHFGIGSAQRVDRIRLRWPNGKTETLDGMNTGRYITIREGDPR